MNTEQPAANPAPVIPAPAETKPSAVYMLNTKVAEIIGNSGPTVIDKTIKVLADREIDKRATALLAGIEAANATRSELRKVDRPDVKSPLGRDGKPLGDNSYSEARLKEIKKATEKLAKIEKAIDKATEKSDWADLFNLKNLVSEASAAPATEAAE